MTYTVRYAHLDKTYVKKGDKVLPDMCICRMGTTGQSTAAHLHIDCVEGRQNHIWTLDDSANDIVRPAHRQINYFIDEQLFHSACTITSYYNDPLYMMRFGKVHLGYDVVPTNRHETTANYDIFWNRSMTGEVIDVINHNGYGLTLLIRFDV